MTVYKIVYSSGALLDLREARLWYNLQQKELGKRFVDDVKKTVAFIKLNLHFASVKFNNIRTAACKLSLIQFITKLMNTKV
jgi:hypothetical protein